MKVFSSYENLYYLDVKIQYVNYFDFHLLNYQGLFYSHSHL